MIRKIKSADDLTLKYDKILKDIYVNDLSFFSILNEIVENYGKWDITKFVEYQQILARQKYAKNVKTEVNFKRSNREFIPYEVNSKISPLTPNGEYNSFALNQTEDFSIKLAHLRSTYTDGYCDFDVYSNSNPNLIKIKNHIVNRYNIKLSSNTRYKLDCNIFKPLNILKKNNKNKGIKEGTKDLFSGVFNSKYYDESGKEFDEKKEMKKIIYYDVNENEILTITNMIYAISKLKVNKKIKNINIENQNSSLNKKILNAISLLTSTIVYRGFVLGSGLDAKVDEALKLQFINVLNNIDSKHKINSYKLLNQITKLSFSVATEMLEKLNIHTATVYKKMILMNEIPLNNYKEKLDYYDVLTQKINAGNYLKQEFLCKKEEKKKYEFDL